MTLRPPAHKELERAIEARLAAGEVLAPSHASHVLGCMSCAQLFDDLAGLAEQLPQPPAGLNQRLLRAVIADQEARNTTTSLQQFLRVLTLGAVSTALIILAVTITTSSSWASSLRLFWQVTLGE